MSATGTSRADRAEGPHAIPPSPPPKRGPSINSPTARGHGFTLIEMLVVVLLIGIIATFAVLSIGNRALDDQLDNEARRLHQLFRLAADEAVLQGIELGFRHTPKGYTFLYLDPEEQRWVVPDDRLFRSREIEEPFYLELRVEDQPVPPAKPPKEGESVQPQVLLSSSGEVTQFSLSIRARDHAPYFQLDGNLIGEMTLERKGAT